MLIGWTPLTLSPITPVETSDIVNFPPVCPRSKSTVTWSPIPLKYTSPYYLCVTQITPPTVMLEPMPPTEPKFQKLITSGHPHITMHSDMGPYVTRINSSTLTWGPHVIHRDQAMVTWYSKFIYNNHKQLLVALNIYIYHDKLTCTPRPPIYPHTQLLGCEACQ